MGNEFKLGNVKCKNGEIIVLKLLKHQLAFTPIAFGEMKTSV